MGTQSTEGGPDWGGIATAIAEAIVPVVEQAIVGRIAKSQPAPAQIPASTGDTTSSAPGAPPVADSEARRFFAGSRRELQSPATISDIVQVLEHLGIAGTPVSRGQPEPAD